MLGNPHVGHLLHASVLSTRNGEDVVHPSGPATPELIVGINAAFFLLTKHYIPPYLFVSISRKLQAYLAEYLHYSRFYKKQKQVFRYYQ